MKQTIVFKKRRWYGSKVREPGEVVTMEYKHARAFIRANAAVLSTSQPKKKKNKEIDSSINETQINETQQEEQVIQPEEVPGEVLEVTEPESPESPEPELEEPEEITPVQLEDLTYRELQELCKQRDLSASGTKSELITRLREGE